MRIMRLLLLLILVLIMGCSSKSPTGQSIKLTNPIKTCKMVDVPYQEQEAYTEREPYQAIEEYQVSLKFTVVEAYDRASYSDPFNYKTKGIVKVRNVDSETGTFQVDMIFTTLKDGSRTLSSRKYVMAGETVEFSKYYDSSLGEDVEFKYRVTPPKKTLTRTVTKYRDVTKYRTVTNYKKEEVCT